MSRSRAYAALAVGVICALLSVPVAALATTGTATDLHVRITITSKGTAWSPAVHNQKARTGTTVRFHVVNQGPGRHWFRFGTRRTKLLAKGASQTFFYYFGRPGKVAWQTGPGKRLGSGEIPVVFPPSFH